MELLSNNRVIMVIRHTKRFNYLIMCNKDPSASKRGAYSALLFTGMWSTSLCAEYFISYYSHLLRGALQWFGDWICSDFFLACANRVTRNIPLCFIPLTRREESFQSCCQGECTPLISGAWGVFRLLLCLPGPLVGSHHFGTFGILDITGGLCSITIWTTNSKSSQGSL